MMFSLHFKRGFLLTGFLTGFLLFAMLPAAFAYHAERQAEQQYETDELSFYEGFSDVPVNHRNYQAIETLRANGLIAGYGDGTFQPARLVTRAEAVAMIVRGMNPQNPHPDEGRYKNCFDDTHREWYARYVCFGKSERFLQGYPGTQLFRPGANVIIVELLRLTIDAFKVPVQAPITLYKQMWDIPKGYKNQPELWYGKPQWWETYYVTARFYDFVDVTHEAGKMMSRGEVAEIIHRIMKHKNLIPST